MGVRTEWQRIHTRLNQLRQFITSLGWYEPIDFAHERGCLLGAGAGLDVACTDMREDLIDELNQAGIRILLADAEGATRSRLEHTSLLERIGKKISICVYQWE